MCSFCFDCTTNIYLYGASSIGKIFCVNLLNNNFRVLGFIDKRADELSLFLGLPVYSLLDDGLNKENVVIISVKNVFEHSRIAKQLNKLGFQKIIYRPFDVLSGNHASDNNISINNAYSIISENYNGSSIIDIPCYNENDCFEDIKMPILDEDGDSLVVPVPVTVLFSDNKNDSPVYNILCLKSHINFSRFCLGLSNCNCSDYLEYCINAALKQNLQITESWKQNVISNRVEIFNQMNHKFHTCPSFFVENAPKVVWNKNKHYFNLCSGKHRACFLASINCNYIPVRMSKKDFKLFADEKNARWIFDEYISQLDKGYIPPIENPFFYDCSSSVESFYYNLIRSAADLINNYYWGGFNNFTLNKLKAYVDVDDNGFLERYLNRIGMTVTTNEENTIGTSKTLHSFFGFKDNCSKNNSFDVAFVSEGSLKHSVNAKHIMLLSNKKKNLPLLGQGVVSHKTIYFYELDG